MTTEAAIVQLKKAITHLSREDKAAIDVAIELGTRAHAGQQREDGTPYITHPLIVATYLANWGADRDTIIAGILHDTLEDTSLSEKQIHKQFGKRVLLLVEGVTKFSKADFAEDLSLDAKIETLRKLFEVMRTDIRVVLIKFADRLHNIETIHNLPDERKIRFAQETMDVYYKIADHLGLREIRRVFSGVCSPILHPEEHEEFLMWRETEEQNIKQIIPEMKEQLQEHTSKDALVSLIAKPQTYQSYTDVRKYRKTGEPPMVLVAIAKDRNACYELLKAFHELYRPISGRFRDYIAMPLENGYQCIRTTVVDEDGQIIPVRIRTPEMDESEKHGVLLHCFNDDKAWPGFSWLQRSETLDLATKERSDSFWEALQTDVFQETVAITVNGIEQPMPVGSTVLDAAYAAIEEDAHRIHEIFVNGESVRFSQVIVEEDLIKLDLSQDQQVRHEWLDLISTTYARTHILQALQHKTQKDKLEIGERLLQKELDYFRFGVIGDLTKAQKTAVVDHFNRKSFEAVIAMIGEGVVPARDAVFLLFPEKKPEFLRGEQKDRPHSFQLSVRVHQAQRGMILSQISALAELHHAKIHSTKFKWYESGDFVTLYVRGTSKSRIHFADMLSNLQRQEDIISVHSMLSFQQKFFLLLSILLGFTVILINALLVPLLAQSTILPPLVLQILPMIPILGVNYFILRLLQQYIIAIRNDRLYISLGLLMNLIGLGAVISQSANLSLTQIHIFPLVTIFVFSMVYLGYRFFQTESLCSYLTNRQRRLTTDQWSKIKKEKWSGYFYRIGAVTIWGLLPIYLRYTPVTQVPPSIRIFMMSAGAVLVTLFALCMRNVFANKKLRVWDKKFSIAKGSLLMTIIITQGLYMHFQITSLLHTTSTNFLLFQNFAPVLALLAAAVLWRHSIAYLKDPRHMLWIFVTFLLGSTGCTMIIYHTISSHNTGTVLGDILGLIAMMFDTVVTIAQIRYMQLHSRTLGMVLNLHVFGILTLIMLPAYLVLLYITPAIFSTLTVENSIYAVGAGFFTGTGLMLNFEAFRRIDGFIAFLMFNASILITFVIEMFFFNAFQPTTLLVLGGLLIISSSIVAELINSHCQKKGL